MGTMLSFRLFFPGLATMLVMAKWYAATTLPVPALCSALLLPDDALRRRGIFDIGVTVWLKEEFGFPLE